MKKFVAVLLTLAMAVCFAGCGGNDASETEAKDIDLRDFYDNHTGYFTEMMVLDEATMGNLLGIQADDCVQAVAAVCANGLKADEIWLIQAKDQQTLEKYQALAESRLDIKYEEAESYIPDQVPAIENGVIVTNGLYLALLVAEDSEALKADFQTSFN